MAIELTEKMIHRTIGTVVLVIFMITITPSFFHKSHMKIEQQVDIAVTLPKPPPKPQIIIASEPKLSKLQPAEKISPTPARAPKIIVKKTIKNLKILSAPKIEEHQITVAKRTTSVPKKLYTVQLGSFGDKRNAINLVNNLKKQGFVAAVVVMTNKNTHAQSYRVLVGKERDRNNAIDLQRKLANLVKLNGFVVYEEIA